MMVGKPLPPSFTSVYRLFLRATSSSVLNHRSSTRRLRRLWRPTFSQAADVIRRLQSLSNTDKDAHVLTDWLKVWQERGSSFDIAWSRRPTHRVSTVDNTLSILSNSSYTRGIPHKLTRNLASLYLSHAIANKPKHIKTGSWNPHKDLTAYTPKTVISPQGRKRDAKEQASKALSDDAWGSLGSVIKMAEGRHGILLGRIIKR